MGPIAEDAAAVPEFKPELPSAVGPAAAASTAASVASDLPDIAANEDMDDYVPYFQRVSISGDDNTGVRKSIFIMVVNIGAD